MRHYPKSFALTVRYHLENMTINKLDFWDENYYNHPPLTDGMIRHAESTFGITLPSSLIELLLVQNGGYTKGFIFPINVKTSWSDDHVPLNHLFGIVDMGIMGTPFNLLNSAYYINEWGLPENQVLISGEGAWWISLDYRNGSIPSINWFDVDANQDIKLADNFEDFIASIKPESELNY